MILSVLENGRILTSVIEEPSFDLFCDVLCVGAGSAGVYAADSAAREGADVIIRGLRSSEDLLFEMQLAEANHKIGGVETLFLSCQSEYSMISSTIVRDCASHGAPIDTMVPREIVGKIYDAFGVRPETERKD